MTELGAFISALIFCCRSIFTVQKKSGRFQFLDSQAAEQDKSKMKKVIVICGPTGIGKTSIAINLARKFKGEIISADSMQVYKYLNIGTAKPDPEELSQAPHHLVDFLDPADPFDAGQFADSADRVIRDLFSQGKLPVIAGGTGLYIRSLLFGLFRSRPLDEKIIARLNRELALNGSRFLHEKLEQCDPQAAHNIHPNDTFRLIRALEYYDATGQRISKKQHSHGFQKPRYDYLKLGLRMDRQKLYDRIDLRVELMIENGLLKEVQQLVDNGYSLELKAMQSIGYKHMGLYLKNEVGWDEAVRLLRRDTRRYAKRQFTWFNHEEDIVWIHPSDIDAARNAVKDFLT